MITKQQAMGLRYRDEVFYALPVKATKHIVCRVNGNPQHWVLTPEKFRVPLKIGFNGHAEINESNAEFYHLPSACPCRECAK